jgi:RNA polymerase sigma factor (sigma-70 family)
METAWTMTSDSAVAKETDFANFYEAEVVRLIRALYLLTGDLAEAEDLAQETMIRIYQRWTRVRHMESSVGYVYRVAFRLTQRRLRRRTKTTLLHDGNVADSEDALMRVDIRTDVMRALTLIPDAQREVLILKEWLGLSTAEIASLLRLKPASVRVRLHRAREALRRALEGA